MKARALVDAFSDGEAAAALLQLATQLQEARAAAEAAQSNAENAARKKKSARRFGAPILKPLLNASAILSEF